VTVGLSLLAVVVFATGVFALTRPKHHGPSHPDQWDPRVLDIVHFDEKHRGLKFEHPVFVDFLSADEYAKRARSDPNELTSEDKKSLQNEQGELRALGLMTGDVDLFKAENELADSGTLAFYDPDTERVSVRGTDMTVELRVTLVHELTHALQDQHFDIGSTREKSFETSGESTAFRALVEGDAVRIENEYIDSLSDAERSEYLDSNSASVEKSQQQLQDVPIALQAFMAAPYIYGPPFAEVLDADGGQREVDEAFKKPPVDDEQETDPPEFIHGRGPVQVDKPSLPDGVKDESDSGDLGAVTWFLMLAERIPPTQALQAADGWGGDAYVAYEQAGKTCMRLAWRGDTAKDRTEMRDALDAWVGALPSNMATVTENGEQLLVETCDPGSDSGIEISGNSMDALSMIEVRSYLMVEKMQSGDNADSAFEFGDCVVDKLPFDVVAKVATSEDNPPKSFFDAIDSCS
jgi:Zn-dependent peptidase ImmA (M78 family)